MQLALGLFLVFLSGAMAGSALAPIKLMRKYAFENYWAVHSLIGTVIIPWVLAFATVPHLLDVYNGLPASVLLVPPVFAFSWGIASTLGGLCVSRIGLSLSYALIIGIGAAAGALIPMLYFNPAVFGTRPGELLVTGVAVMIAGLVVVARAGRQKEKIEQAKLTAESGLANSADVIHGSFAAGLGMAVLAGILSAGLNFSFAFSSPIADAAVKAGASKTSATYAVWAVAMLGGMIPNLAYALIRCARNHSWRRFAMSPQTDVPLGILMGSLFMGSTALYGLGAVRLGVLGASVGWGIMQVMQIVVGNLNGFIAGEWAVAGPKAIRQMFAGIAVLVLASVLMALGNYVETHG